MNSASVVAAESELEDAEASGNADRIEAAALRLEQVMGEADAAQEARAERRRDR